MTLHGRKYYKHGQKTDKNTGKNICNMYDKATHPVTYKEYL